MNGRLQENENCPKPTERSKMRSDELLFSLRRKYLNTRQTRIDRNRPRRKREERTGVSRHSGSEGQGERGWPAPPVEVNIRKLQRQDNSDKLCEADFFSSYFYYYLLRCHECKFIIICLILIFTYRYLCFGAPVPPRVVFADAWTAASP